MSLHQSGLNLESPPPRGKGAEDQPPGFRVSWLCFNHQGRTFSPKSTQWGGQVFPWEGYKGKATTKACFPLPKKGLCLSESHNKCKLPPMGRKEGGLREGWKPFRSEDQVRAELGIGYWPKRRHLKSSRSGFLRICKCILEASESVRSVFHGGLRILSQYQLFQVVLPPWVRQW